MRPLVIHAAGLLAVLAFVTLRAVPAGAQTGGNAAADEAAIRALVAKYVEAREQRSADAIEALFTEDADQLTSSGEWRRGRDNVVRGALASSQRTGGKRTITVERVRALGPDLAIADGRYEISDLAGGGNRQMWTTFIMARNGPDWRIAAIRNMLPAR